METKGVNSILKNAANLLGGRAVTHLARGIYVVVLTRYLGPELYGLFAYGHHWYLVFLPFAGAGAIGNLLGREIAIRSETHNELVSATFNIQMILCVAAAVVSVVIGWLVNSDETIRMLLFILSFALIARAIAIWAEGVFVAHEQARFAFYQNATLRPLEIVLGTSILISGGGLIEVASVHATVWMIQAVWALYIVWRSHTGLRWSVSSVAETSSKIKGLYWLVLFNTWILQGPVVLYRHSIDSDIQLGQFALVMQLYLLACAVPDAIVRAALPILSRTALRKDGKDALFMQGMICIALVLGVSLGLTGEVIGPWVIPLVFGAEYTQVGGMIGLALYLLALLTINSSGVKVLVAHGHYNVALSTSAIGAASLSLLVPLLATGYGIGGALFGIGLALAISITVLLTILVRKYSLSLNSWLTHSITSAIVALVTFYIAKSYSQGAALIIAYAVLAVGNIGLFKILRKGLKSEQAA